jgi:hypothetical protein
MTRFSTRALAGAAITVLLGSFAVIPAAAADPVVPVAPVVTWSTEITNGQSFAYGTVPTSPTCTAMQAATQVGCEVAGYGDKVGSYTLVPMVGEPAVAATPTIGYTVTATWKLKGFFSPVKKGKLTRHYGSNTPLKFSIKENGKSKAKSDISSFSAVLVSCTDLTPVVPGTTTDLLKVTKKTGGSFHANWKTSKIKPVKVTVPAKGKAKAKKVIVPSCYQVTMTAMDGQALTALVTFKK